MIIDGQMQLNNAGRMVDDTWHEIPDHCSGIELDMLQIMPNHLHGITVIREVGIGLCASLFYTSYAVFLGSLFAITLHLQAICSR